MFDLPNPFSNAATSVSQEVAATAVALPQPPCATAGQSAAEGGGPESPAADALNPHETAGDLDATDDIHEIFYYARKLARDRRFVLDVDAFMLELEEPPLFLRQA